MQNVYWRAGERLVVYLRVLFSPFPGFLVCKQHSGPASHHDDAAECDGGDACGPLGKGGR